MASVSRVGRPLQFGATYEVEDLRVLGYQQRLVDFGRVALEEEATTFGNPEFPGTLGSKQPRVA